jgi:hypothetical protein
MAKHYEHHDPIVILMEDPSSTQLVAHFVALTRVALATMTPN